MGKSSSKPEAPKQPLVGSGSSKIETTTTESTGFHMLEFHGSSFTGGAFMLTALAIIGVLLYFCQRYRCRSNRQRQWILEMGGAPEVAQGWGRQRGPKRDDFRDSADPWFTRVCEPEPIWGRLEEPHDSRDRHSGYKYNVPHQPTRRAPEPPQAHDYGHGATAFPVATKGPRFIYSGPPLESLPTPNFPRRSEQGAYPKRQDNNGLSIPGDFWDSVRQGPDASHNEPAIYQSRRKPVTQHHPVPTTRSHVQEAYESGKPFLTDNKKDVSSILNEM